MYRDFGDVFTMDFEQWWRSKGQLLFAERLSPPEVRELGRSGRGVAQLGHSVTFVVGLVTRHVGIGEVHHTRQGNGGLSERSGGSQGSQSNNERLCTESSAKLQQRFRNISTCVRVNFARSLLYNKLSAAHPFFLNGSLGKDSEMNGKNLLHRISNALHRNCPCAHTTVRLTHEFFPNCGKQRCSHAFSKA